MSPWDLQKLWRTLLTTVCVFFFLSIKQSGKQWMNIINQVHNCLINPKKKKNKKTMDGSIIVENND